MDYLHITSHEHITSHARIHDWYIFDSQFLTLWRPLLPYGCSYHKASCARPGQAVIYNFWHPGTLTLSLERQNYKSRLNPVCHRMLYDSCTHMATVGVRGLKTPFYKVATNNLLSNTSNFVSTEFETALNHTILNTRNISVKSSKTQIHAKFNSIACKPKTTHWKTATGLISYLHPWFGMFEMPENKKTLNSAKIID